MSWFLAFLVLSALIFFHELGHYSVAKLNGVHVDVFSIGFGKKLFSFNMFNTSWQIASIPLGGYVKMKGQDDSDPTGISTDADSYNAKSPLQRISILLAGPAANFILAFILYFTIALGGPPALSPVIGEVLKDSPAMSAGLLKDDKIVSINGVNISTWTEMSEAIKNSEGSITLVVERGAFLENITLTPKLTETTNMYKENVKRKMVGISSSGMTHTRELGLSDSVVYAYDETIKASVMIFTGLEKLLSGDVPSSELGGVITIVKITSDASDSGWMSLFFFAALISVNLGVLNLLPIPALDGGHIMFNLYELIMRRAPSEAILLNMTLAGWAILLGLMSLGLYNDINRLVGS